MGAEECFLCCSDHTDQCDQCEHVYYCTDHLKYHKVGHMGRITATMLNIQYPLTGKSNPCLQLEPSGQCCPYKVQEVEGAGRGLVAARDIAPGEHILTAFPAAIGPCAR